jgi:8-oxo-dGTP pyrophosphatase MutT (NUDIX family)
VLNQPAGHLEPNETLLEAAVRETLEETCWQIALTGYLGVTIVNGANGVCYLRHSFVGTPIQYSESFERDAKIIDTHWLTRHEIQESTIALRHPVVLDIIDQYLENKAVSLKLVRSL